MEESFLKKKRGCLKGRDSLFSFRQALEKNAGEAILRVFLLILIHPHNCLKQIPDPGGVKYLIWLFIQPLRGWGKLPA